MDWKSVAEKIIQDDQNKWDRKISAPQLRDYDNGKLLLLDDNGERVGLRPSDWTGSNQYSLSGAKRRDRAKDL
jgi:hypothetical protein